MDSQDSLLALGQDAAQPGEGVHLHGAPLLALALPVPTRALPALAEHG